MAKSNHIAGGLKPPFPAMRKLSPLRNSTQATDAAGLVREQLAHFGIDPATPFGQQLSVLAERLYASQADVEQLWHETLSEIQHLDRADRIAWFNAKKFLTFQLAKLLDTLQNPSRRSYQSLGFSNTTQSAKGPYAVFDNVAAIFSATPVIARTATYVYACAEWIADAFRGQELLLEIYSRLLNPTSISLANFIVDLEAGPYAGDYFALNFDSGMAAIDSVLAHVLGRDDLLVTSRNLYGGAHQLIHDWYAKPSNLAISVETFDGFHADDFQRTWQMAKQKHAAQLQAGRKAYLYLESPCNPHGYVLDLPEICRCAHAEGLRVIVDATVGTPFLCQSLQKADELERPDFVIHSYTKDLSGTGSVIAGVAIAKNADMFIPKGETVGGVAWNETMFWNVYYVKGAFLNADAAFEVIQGMRTLELRMMAKCINTLILAQFFNSHASIQVHCNALQHDANHSLLEKLHFLGLPAPLFTVDMPAVPRESFARFFDALAPAFDHMISLGQANTIVSCPALTTHSELDAQALAESGIQPTTIRFAVGDEDPKDLIAHFIAASQLTLDEAVPGFSQGFMAAAEVDALVETCYLETHRKYIQAKPPLADKLR